MKTTETESCCRYLQKQKKIESRKQKDMIQEKCNAFRRFNEWEKQILEKPDMADCLALVFELYDLVPDQAKQRPVNVNGIIKMREGLACLT
jgi:hypothetical protein